MKSQEIDSRHVQDALNLLKDTRLKIVECDSVRPREERQIQNALNLIHGDHNASSQSDKRTTSYQQFLVRVLDTTNIEMIALCAVALGKSRVANMRDGVRRSLPFHIKRIEATLDCTIFRTVLNRLNSCVYDNINCFGVDC